MVDFQSRDTRRGPSLDDEDDEAEDADTATGEETADEQAAPPSESDPAPETDDGGSESTDAEAESTPLSADSAGTDPLADEDDGAGAPDDDGAGTEAATDPLSADSTGSGADTDDGAAEPAESDSPDETTTQRQTAARDGDQTTPKASAAPETPVQVAVVTVGMDGDERVERAVATAFESAGHTITLRERLRGEYDTLQQVVDRLVGRADVDVVVTAGGIGIAADQVTIEAVHPLFEKALPGFGEAFRALLFEQVGTAIVSVRSTAGVTDGTLVFCLPGDVEAAELAVDEILAPETPTLVAALR